MWQPVCAAYSPSWDLCWGACSFGEAITLPPMPSSRKAYSLCRALLSPFSTPGEIWPPFHSCSSDQTCSDLCMYLSLPFLRAGLKVLFAWHKDLCCCFTSLFWSNSFQTSPPIPLSVPVCLFRHSFSLECLVVFYLRCRWELLFLR